MKRYLPFLIVGLVAAITFGAGFTLYRAKFVAAPAVAKQEETNARHVRGKKEAAVTIEEFGDFQCPPCSLMAASLKKIEDDYGSKVRVIFHHFPLPNHAHARPAAHAAEAADMQGHFWEMHDLLYKEQNNWSKTPDDVTALLTGYAGSIGLDVERFKNDMQSEKAKELVEADHALGASRGVTSTPSLFVNNVMVPATSLSPDALRKVINSALEPKEKKKP
jgi:protein-disulfide isomerase